ncbi:MAG: phosphoribosylaminoimidazolesuccinocarboxamide synthase [Verrucomicrobiota bacterium]|nr:phosphoribosylaminoimidazolesuccinocarboxamide synthase [Verrucomicrobiota bacterium]
MNYDKSGALLRTSFPGVDEPIRGKVRDIYVLEDSILMVTSDRLSAFDVVMPNGIPDKGKVLNSLSMFWFEKFPWIKNHVITADPKEYPAPFNEYTDDLKGRSMLVEKLDIFSVECVARGYIIGSGWKDYQKTGKICGIELNNGYAMADKLENPIFTPAFKAEQGDHDENITYAKVIDMIGSEKAAKLREITLRLYSEAAEYAETKGIIIADTKFEFGEKNAEIILADEVLTPDSSRFWPKNQYEPGKNPPSYDKQFVRDYLETLGWGKVAPGPLLPDDIVSKTRDKYLSAYEKITGSSLSL